jgi:hypothetical protein
MRKEKSSILNILVTKPKVLNLEGTDSKNCSALIQGQDDTIQPQSIFQALANTLSLTYKILKFELLAIRLVLPFLRDAKVK